MLGHIAPLETGKRAHPDIVELREEEGVDEVPAFDRELWVIDCFLRDLEARRPRTQKAAAPAPVEFGLRLARAGNEDMADRT